MIPLPFPPQLIEKKDKNTAVFEIKALYPGYGMTLGNSLRRVLLSSLPGAAITRIKIEGVPHEFSTIPGVMEDVVLILLNLKEIRFRIHSEEPQKASIEVKGKKEIKAGDIKCPSQIEVVNEEAPVATLTQKDAELEMELWIEKGVGYETKEERKEEKLPIGTLALDAIYSPVQRVSFKVRDMRVGERTDFDRLTLEVETDGTITPEDAFIQASNILLEHFDLISQGFQEEEVEKEKSDIEVDDLDISTRVANILKENRMKTAAGILRRKKQTLKEVEGLGEKSVEEIEKALKKHGFELKE